MVASGRHQWTWPTTTKTQFYPVAAATRTVIQVSCNHSEKSGILIWDPHLGSFIRDPHLGSSSGILIWDPHLGYSSGILIWDPPSGIFHLESSEILHCLTDETPIT